ncbi:hypothetical protein HMPREF0044_1087 [Gleimia coleocanis DSM 15436]|uniref:DNA primase n=1 Tax=Gleimia coleocanis DSM 15436 TaxID=525245 RepID=C0W0K9_9ACTO|nr:hypothetical protein [Gleimia coleocanis]EEH64068.1 hypothetical protein HMPREF0044_1087 [Gleimia coleocanis DSM 15436]
MGTNPQDSLNRLIAALEAHSQAARSAHLSGSDDTAVLETAEERLRDAFFTYDDILFNHYGIDLPFEMLGERDDDFDDFDDEDDDFDDEDFDDFDDEDDDFDEDDEEFEFDEDGVYVYIDLEDEKLR